MTKVDLSPEMIQALLALCDGVPLRGPESKIVVARAQAALIEALQEDLATGRDASPVERTANRSSGPGHPSGGPQS